jgi:chromate reductase
MNNENAAKPRILAFAGSSRTDSFNKKLVKIAAKGAEQAGGEVTVADLRDFPMPLYDGDLEAREGLPPAAKAWKRLLMSHDGFLIASPEYNSSISALLKNAIDWASRTETEDEPPLICFKGKVASLMSASPGNLGGLRGLVTVRSILNNIGTLVLPEQVAISKAHEAFTEDDALKNVRQQASVEQLGAGLVQILQKLKS